MEYSLKEIITSYNMIIGGIDEQANDSEDRAYGGIIRAAKGSMVEVIAKNLVKIAWDELGGAENRLDFKNNDGNKKIKIFIDQDYIETIQEEEIRKYIEKNIKKFIYSFTVDVPVYIDKELIMGIECKTYTENAMIKRIMVDFTFLKKVAPNAIAILLELESQLGGDYSKINKKIKIGSCPTRTIMSYFKDVDLKIITLLEGDRKVDKPIHKKEYFKELKEEELKKTVIFFKGILEKYL